MKSSDNSNYNVAVIVPTGIGASIGGYAGDALPVVRLFASVVGDDGYVITHPNVMNGAMMYYPMENVLYVEGYALDEFAKGKIGLEPLHKKSQKIGLLLDKGIEDDLRIRHVQVADAARATLGMSIHHSVITSHPLNISLQLSSSHASWGSIDDVGYDSMMTAAGKLIAKGCTAIAVVARFPEDDEVLANSNIDSAELFASYRMGNGVDAIAGLEAIISHMITKRYNIPCAHAPAFNSIDADGSVSPKACAEELGYTFLPCVLANLNRAPNLIHIQHHDDKDEHRISSSSSSSYKNMLRNYDVDAVIVPINALGGAAVLSFIAQKKLIIAVQDNHTCMNVDKASFNRHHGDDDACDDHIIVARSYMEAAGYVAAHKAGILFEALSSSIRHIPSS